MLQRDVFIEEVTKKLEKDKKNQKYTAVVLLTVCPILAVLSYLCFLFYYNYLMPFFGDLSCDS